MNTLATVSSLDYSALDRAELQPSTRIKYQRALERFVRANVPLEDLAEYATGLSTSERSFLKAALSLVSADKLNQLKAGATPQNVGAIQAVTYRMEAMRGAIHVQATKGAKTHIWLSPKQVKEITALAVDNPLHWLVLGLMLGAGLRREELVKLTFSDVKELPDEAGMRTVLEIRGKGDKSRVVPISKLLSDRLNAWRAERNASDKDRVIPISAVRCFQIVRAYGKKIKMPALAPHDLRRTYAQLSHKGGMSIEDTGYLLGHSSVTTTQRYLDLKLNTHITGSDFVPLSGD